MSTKSTHVPISEGDALYTGEPVRSPITNFFLKSLSHGDKKTSKDRDSQAPKRRGPKPDSKPALTRRQELNRQAQRTHRERKEVYIKSLENEVIRIREQFQVVVRERNAAQEENQNLKDLLTVHGIAFDALEMSNRKASSNSPFCVSSSGSASGSYGHATNSTGFTSPPSGSATLAANPGFASNSPGLVSGSQQQKGPIDYDQIGIDFVLTLERPCMDHMQYLLVRSTKGTDEEISGHAMMATCPPSSHIHDHPDELYPHKMPDVGAGDLLNLLDLSNRLPLDGEITPVMAWANIMAHTRFLDLTEDDFKGLKEELVAKVRCYGFGAVLEEFEVRDALGIALGSKE